MPTFDYLAKNKNGKDVRGTQEAENASELVKQLKTQGFIVIRVEEAKKKPSVFSIQKGAAPKVARGKSGAVKLDDLVVFARQMATLVNAGIPLVQALDILADQVEKEKLRQILRTMHRDVQSGKSLSESMQAFQNIFTGLFVHMVRAGETSGKLQEILDRVAQYLEKSSALQKKVKSAMMYPAVVSLMAFAITFLMLAFVIPKFADIFAGLDAKLPAMTQGLIDVSNFLAVNWWWVLSGLGGLVWGLKKFAGTPAGRMIWDSFTLRAPIFGPIVMKVAVSKFARTLSTLVKSGISILAALEIVSKTFGNVCLEKVIIGLMDSVQRGESISGQLEKSGLFPSMVVRMIAIGEETGELEEMLSKVADFYDTQVDAAVAGLTSLIEPLIIAFLGIVIGGIVIALFLPILTLTQAIK